MPLIHYSHYFYYPGGGPAGGEEMTVMRAGGNQPTALFSDKAGTVPLTNPLETENDGRLSFYAAPGNYAVWFVGEYWAVPVDEDETDPAWPGLFVHEQSTPSAVWTVNHHLGIEPSATVLVDGQRTEADVTHPSTSQTVLTFGAPTAGVAHLRG